MTSSKRTKFLKAEEIESGIDEVVSMARARHVDIALAGGAAMQIWGSERLTKDVDFLASDLIEDLRTLRPLSFGGVAAVTPAGVPVDLIIRDDAYGALYEHALERATVLEGIPVRVVSAEYMAAIKLSAAREKDILDLHFLLTDAEDFDYKVASAIVELELGVFAADEFERARDEAVFLKQRDESAKLGPRRRR